MQFAPSPQLLTEIAARFRALSDDSRLRLLLVLRDGEQNVRALTEQTGIAQASVSKHLGVLRQAGLVDSRREGPSVIYFVRDESIFQMCEIVCDGVRRRAQETHAALGLTGEGPSNRK